MIALIEQIVDGEAEQADDAPATAVSFDEYQEPAG